MGDTTSGDAPTLVGSTGPPRVPASGDRSKLARHTDSELMAGSRDEFGMLFDRYGTEIFRFCARRLGPDLAEDVVAETFLVAYERRDHFERSRPSARPWLYGVATNLIARQRSAERRAYQAAVDAAGRTDLVVDGGYLLAERAAERADALALTRAMSGALADLPGGQRDVLLMFAAGLGYADIASALRIPVGTVMSRLHRARRKLVSRLPADVLDSHDHPRRSR